MIKKLFSLFQGEKLYKDLDDEEFQRALTAASKPVVLDVRSKPEFDEIKIPNALNIDIHNPKFTERIKHLDKDKFYFVHCRTGNRSKRACKKMIKAGFKNIYNLKGGINVYSGKVV